MKIIKLLKCFSLGQHHVAVPKVGNSIRYEDGSIRLILEDNVFSLELWCPIINEQTLKFHLSRWTDVLARRLLCLERLLGFNLNSDLKWNAYIRSIAKDAPVTTWHLLLSSTFTRGRSGRKWRTATIYGHELAICHFPVTIDPRSVSASLEGEWWNISHPITPFSQTEHRKPLVALSLFPWKVYKRTIFLSSPRSNLHS